MQNEEPALQKLLDATDAVQEKTKIATLLDLLKTRLAGRQVLVFLTEYEPTQALLMTALWREFGSDCATFINGDERLIGVHDAEGEECILDVPRAEAVRRFNAGECRFLISTEAGGEGIDLQEK